MNLQPSLFDSMADKNQQGVMTPDLSNQGREGQPTAILWSNGDGTASGRFKEAPFYDFEITVKQHDPYPVLHLEMMFAPTGEIVADWTFDLAQQVKDQYTTGYNGTHKVFHAQEDTSWVIVDLRSDYKNAAWGVQRRYNPDDANEGWV